MIIALEIIIAVALIIGFCFEDKIIEFEDALISKIKNKIKNKIKKGRKDNGKINISRIFKNIS